MIEDTPQYEDVPTIAEDAAPVYTPCSNEIREERANLCRACSFMTDDHTITRCSRLSLDINLVISSNEIACPEEIW